MRQPVDRTRARFYVAESETVNGQSWIALHITHDDAMRNLNEVARDW